MKLSDREVINVYLVPFFEFFPAYLSWNIKKISKFFWFYFFGMKYLHVSFEKILRLRYPSSVELVVFSHGKVLTAGRSFSREKIFFSFGQVEHPPELQQLFSGRAQLVPGFVEQHAFSVTRPDFKSTWHSKPVPSGPGEKHKSFPPGNEKTEGSQGAHWGAKQFPKQ